MSLQCDNLSGELQDQWSSSLDSLTYKLVNNIATDKLDNTFESNLNQTVLELSVKKLPQYFISYHRSIR